jgi:uncharacterized protein (DUF433 family)
VQALIDYLEGGHCIEEFLDDLPTVTRGLAIAALEQAKAHRWPMRVPLDECGPRGLGKDLTGH